MSAEPYAQGLHPCSWRGGRAFSARLALLGRFLQCGSQWIYFARQVAAEYTCLQYGSQSVNSA